MKKLLGLLAVFGVMISLTSCGAVNKIRDKIEHKGTTPETSTVEIQDVEDSTTIPGTNIAVSVEYK